MCGCGWAPSLLRRGRQGEPQFVASIVYSVRVFSMRGKPVMHDMQKLPFSITSSKEWPTGPGPQLGCPCAPQFGDAVTILASQVCVCCTSALCKVATFASVVGRASQFELEFSRSVAQRLHLVCIAHNDFRLVALAKSTKAGQAGSIK
eukprot:364779-Chlamydomonas_euryale.AAC.14